MRKIDLIVIHCSATRADRCYTEHDLITNNLCRNFSGTGYSYYIRKNGDIKTLCGKLQRNSVGICYEGGLDCRGRPADTRTPEQRATLRLLIHQLLEVFPGCRVCGHRDLSPDRNGNGEIEPEEWMKACPCFDAKGQYRGL